MTRANAAAIFMYTPVGSTTATAVGESPESCRQRCPVCASRWRRTQAFFSPALHWLMTTKQDLPKPLSFVKSRLTSLQVISLGFYACAQDVYRPTEPGVG